LRTSADKQCSEAGYFLLPKPLPDMPEPEQMPICMDMGMSGILLYTELDKKYA